MFFQEIETKRLLLKNISNEDSEFILTQFSNDSINEYLFDAEPLHSLEEASDLIDFYLQPEPRLQHRWILVLKSNNEKIGTCGFHCWDQNNKCVDIGYDLKEEYWGQGLMSEALNGIINVANNEMKVQKIHAHIYVDNSKSIRLALRFGFKFYGETEIYLFRDKQYLHNIYTVDFK